jgi:hypothetical protein
MGSLERRRASRSSLVGVIAILFLVGSVAAWVGPASSVPDRTSPVTGRHARPDPSPVLQPGDAEDASVVADRPLIAYEGPDAWQIQTRSFAGRRTEAFANSPSYLPGEILHLAVSTSAPSYTVAIFRLGDDVQLMSRSERRPGTLQTAVQVDRATKMVRARWHYTFEQRIPPDWSSGIYLAKVSGTGGAQAYAPFVVRSTRHSTFLFVSSFMNSEAYNTWGGSSLYRTSLGQSHPSAPYALRVSFDRPFVEEDGAGQLFMLEAPFIAWLEKNDYDVTYTTDYDLSIAPERPPLPDAVIFSGHPEYWGMPLRSWLDEHVLSRGDLGLGMFAADAGYWRVQFGDENSRGPRSFGLYKTARVDRSLAARCPDGYGGSADAFRSLPCGLPAAGNLAEQMLFGVQYGSIVPGYHDYVLAPATPASLLAGTGLRPGDSLGGIVGGEVDRIWTDYPPSPWNMIVATADDLVTRDGTSSYGHAVLRDLPSGGRVFASGTFWWQWGLEPRFAQAHGVPDGFVELTANILAFLAGDQRSAAGRRNV